MRYDYIYRVVYIHPEHREQYSFTSCKRFGFAMDAILNFEKVMNIDRSYVRDAYRLIKDRKEPIEHESV